MEIDVPSVLVKKSHSYIFIKTWLPIFYFTSSEYRFGCIRNYIFTTFRYKDYSWRTERKFGNNEIVTRKINFVEKWWNGPYFKEWLYSGDKVHWICNINFSFHYWVLTEVFHSVLIFYKWRSIVSPLYNILLDC